MHLQTLEKELHKLIPEIEKQFRKPNGDISKAKDVILVIGKTGSGKSTFVNYLLGFDFELKGPRGREELHWKKSEHESYPIDEENEEALKELPAKIGVEVTSETLYPTLYPIYSEYLKKEFIICDCPGLGENRGEELALVTRLGVDLTILAAENLKTILLLIPYPLFIDKKSEHVLNLLDELQSIVKNPKDLDRLNIRVAFTKAEGINKTDIIKFLPKDVLRIKKHFELLKKEDDARIQEMLKQNDGFFKSILSAALNPSLAEKVNAVLENPKTPKQLREDLHAYIKRESIRQIKLALLEKIADSTNLFIPDITDGGIARESLLEDFAAFPPVIQDDKRLICFSGNSTEKQQLEEQLTIRCADNTNLINRYNVMLENKEETERKINEYKRDIESKENQRDSLLGNDVNAVIVEKNNDKKRKEEELDALRRDENRLNGKICKLTDRISELMSEEIVLYRGTVNDYSKPCNISAGEAYRTSWNLFHGRRPYLYYEVSEELNFPIEHLAPRYNKTNANKVTYEERDNVAGRYRIKYIGEYEKDSDLKVGIYVKPKNITGNYTVVHGKDGLQAEKRRKEREMGEIKIAILSKEREIQNTKDEINEYNSGRVLSIVHILPLLEKEINQLQRKLNEEEQKRAQLIDDVESFKKENFKSIINIYRLCHFINSKIPITRNVQLLNEFFALYKKLIAPFEKQFSEISQENVKVKTVKSALNVALAQPFCEGLSYVPVPGRGHCFYHALGLYLGKDKDELRTMVSKYLQTHVDELSDYAELPLNTSYEEYIERVRNTNEWAGNLEIEAFMRRLQRPIAIINPERKIINREDLTRFPGEPIFVYYNNVDQHYDGLVLSHHSSNPREILNKLLVSIDSAGDSLINIESSKGKEPASQPVAEENVLEVEVEVEVENIALLEKCQEYGFKYEVQEKIDNNDNNFLEAASAQLNKIGIGLDIERVKESIIDQITQNFDFYKSDSINNIRQFIDYLQRNDIDSNVNKIVIQALADKFSLRIVLIKKDELIPTIIKPRDGISQGVIYLGYNEKSHFESLIRDEKIQDPKKIEIDLVMEKREEEKEVPHVDNDDKNILPPPLPPRNIAQYVRSKELEQSSKKEQKMEIEDLPIEMSIIEKIIEGIPPNPILTTTSHHPKQDERIGRADLLVAIREYDRKSKPVNNFFKPEPKPIPDPTKHFANESMLARAREEAENQKKIEEDLERRRINIEGNDAADEWEEDIEEKIPSQDQATITQAPISAAKIPYWQNPHIQFAQPKSGSSGSELENSDREMLSAIK
ncbi:MAG: hypothetical protein K0R24_25 [Gammaproteobacteria bacterium]|jgi:energy-coupling factor transporter ATP-binding protein EcfA2|nr:hypothetical protein [Gammaproteobacteria bacterium]